jgi:hypothetical protein
MTAKTLNELRTEKLSATKRKEIARKAARARWGNRNKRIDESGTGWGDGRKP